jgi:hypothetical protein
MDIILKSYNIRNTNQNVFINDELKIDSICYKLNNEGVLQLIKNEIIEIDLDLIIKINDIGKIKSIEPIKLDEKKYTPTQFLEFLSPLLNEIQDKILSLSPTTNILKSQEDIINNIKNIFEQSKNVINYNLTFVTCFYDDLFETEFGGRVSPARKYLYGIESALKMNTPYVIFTWEKDLRRLEEYYISILGEEEFTKRIKIIPYDLYDTPIREIIKTEKNNPKNKDIPGDRSHDVMFGKFLMLQRAINENFFSSENFFWIDAGLSSSSLFPDKYLDKTISEKQWNLCYLFTPKVPEELIKLCSDKVLLVKCNSIGYWIDPNHLPNSVGVSHYIIGGIFGGKKTQVYEYCNIILDSFFYHIKENSSMYFEEVIMTIVYEFNKDRYNVIEFDSWHHEDSGDWAQPHIINKKNFYRIFEKFNNI